MHLHNDGDVHRDGLFWRDGSYPPYPPAEMKKMDQVIATIYRHGMKTAPYFSNHELRQSTEEFTGGPASSTTRATSAPTTTGRMDAPPRRARRNHDSA